MKNDLYQELTDKAIAMLESGKIVWRQTWHGGGPQNPITGTYYRGVNHANLSMDMMLNGWDDPRFLTFQQVNKLGGRIIAGQHGASIIRWQTYYDERENPATGEKEKKFKGTFPYILRAGKYPIKLFNIAQTTGVELPEIGHDLTPKERIEKCDEIIKGYVGCPEILQGGDSACYVPSRDEVHMPFMRLFDDSESYYATLFHELIHSTGHEKRLNRIKSTAFGSAEYSREELVAEFGASILCSEAQITNHRIIENSAAYLAGWITALKKDTRLFIQASQAASKAAAVIMPSLKPKEIESDESETE